jgi:hypothetical protein
MSHIVAIGGSGSYTGPTDPSVGATPPMCHIVAPAVVTSATGAAFSLVILGGGHYTDGRWQNARWWTFLSRPVIDDRLARKGREGVVPVG